MDEPRIIGASNFEQDLIGVLTPEEIRRSIETGQKILSGEIKNLSKEVAYLSFLKAARAGDPSAMAYTAECCYTGTGTVRDPLKALDLALDSAEAGDPYGKYLTGLIYFEGGAGEKDYFQAVRYLTEAADADNVKAMRLLGSCYYDGKGVKKDIYKARDWYEAASLKGDRQAGATFEAICREIEKRKEKLVLVNSALSGDRDAQIEALKNFDRSLRDNKSFESVLIQEEIALIEHLEDTDDPEIQYLLFECYFDVLRNTNDTKKIDTYGEKTLHFLTESAFTGKYAPALNRLGNLFLNGNLVDKDPDSAAACYKEAAEQGYTDSMMSLSNMYASGNGVEKDLDEAIYWVKKALDQAHKDGTATSFFSARLGALVLEKDEQKKNSDKKSTPEKDAGPETRRTFSFSLLWEYIDFNVYGILGAIGLYLMTVLYRALGAGLLTQPLINVHGLPRFILVIISAAGIFFGIYVSLLSILMQIGLEFLAFYPSGILSLFLIVELHDHAQYFTYMTYFAAAVIVINLIIIAVRSIRKN